MASRVLLNTQQVVDLLDHDDDMELDDCFFPGSDDELGFDEVELEDEDTTYGNKYYIIINMISQYCYYFHFLNLVKTPTPVLKMAIVTLMRVNLMT